MKLSIFYFVYACFLIVTWHLGYRKEILCFYGSYFGMVMVYVHHFFVCSMAGHFGWQIHRRHQIKKQSEQLVRDAVEQMKQKVIKSVNNHFRNN